MLQSKDLGLCIGLKKIMQIYTTYTIYFDFKDTHRLKMKDGIRYFMKMMYSNLKLVQHC